MSDKLLPQHATLLTAWAISPAVANVRALGVASRLEREGPAGSTDA